MAGKYGSAYDNRTPTIDGGLGLIIRLNILWNKTDRAALSGDFDDWNNILDRIYCNLSYREPLDVKVDNKTGCVSKLQFNEEDNHIRREFLTRIKLIKMKKALAIKARDRKMLEQAKQEHYETLILKDAWLRKIMQQMGLYMKEIDFNPSTALFGGN